MAPAWVGQLSARTASAPSESVTVMAPSSDLLSRHRMLSITVYCHREQGFQFAPRPVSKGGRLRESFRSNTSSQRGHMKTSSMGGDLLKYLSTKSAANVGANTPTAETVAAETGAIGTLLIPRKVPVKVEPKVFLANERTLLTWLHVVVTLALGSMTILKFAAEETAVNIIFGLVLLPTSLAFVVYALFQCEYSFAYCLLFIHQLKLCCVSFLDMKRAYMIGEHLPGPYIDVAGPTVITVIVIFSIIAQFSARIFYDMS